MDHGGPTAEKQPEKSKYWLPASGKKQIYLQGAKGVATLLPCESMETSGSINLNVLSTEIDASLPVVILSGMSHPYASIGRVSPPHTVRPYGPT